MAKLQPLDLAVREQWLLGASSTNAELGAVMCGLFPAGLEAALLQVLAEVLFDLVSIHLMLGIHYREN